MIIFPDGSAEHLEFDQMDIPKWKRKHDEKSRKKYDIKISTFCFVCDETLTTFKDL